MTASLWPASIAAASDHAARPARQRLIERLRAKGVAVKDFGPDDDAPVDYPDYAVPVVAAVLNGEADCGLLLCGTGLGMSYAANRRPGIRAALCWSVEVAKLAREHNDANILVLPGRVPTLDPLEAILEAFVTTPFPGEPRHVRRLEKIEGACGQPAD